MKEPAYIKQSVTIVLLICTQSLTTSNTCGVGNHDEHFYVSICLRYYTNKIIIIIIIIIGSWFSFYF